MTHGAISCSSQWPQAAVVWGCHLWIFVLSFQDWLLLGLAAVCMPLVFCPLSSSVLVLLTGCVFELLDNLAGIHFSEELVQGHVFRRGARSRQVLLWICLWAARGGEVHFPLSGSQLKEETEDYAFGLFYHSLIIGYVLWARNIQRWSKHFYYPQNLFWG